VAFQGVNVLTMHKLDDEARAHHRYGIVYADFPGPGLVQDLIESNSRGTIVGVGSGRCADYLVSGRRLELYDCHGGANQQWNFASSGEIRGYRDQCVDTYPENGGKGDLVVLSACNGSLSQLWGYNGSGEIVNASTRLCLDARGAATRNYTPLQVWRCHGGPNQRWVRG
jgi:hypothetical protein